MLDQTEKMVVDFLKLQKGDTITMIEVARQTHLSFNEVNRTFSGAGVVELGWDAWKNEIRLSVPCLLNAFNGAPMGSCRCVPSQGEQRA